MRHAFVIITMLVSLTSFSQRKAEYDTHNEQKKEVKQAIMKFFEGFHSGDTSAINKTGRNR